MGDPPAAVRHLSQFTDAIPLAHQPRDDAHPLRNVEPRAPEVDHVAALTQPGSTLDQRRLMTRPPQPVRQRRTRDSRPDDQHLQIRHRRSTIGWTGGRILSLTALPPPRRMHGVDRPRQRSRGRLEPNHRRRWRCSRTIGIAGSATPASSAIAPCSARQARGYRRAYASSTARPLASSSSSARAGRRMMNPMLTRQRGFATRLRYHCERVPNPDATTTVCRSGLSTVSSATDRIRPEARPMWSRRRMRPPNRNPNPARKTPIGILMSVRFRRRSATNRASPILGRYQRRRRAEPAMDEPHPLSTVVPAAAAAAPAAAVASAPSPLDPGTVRVGELPQAPGGRSSKWHLDPSSLRKDMAMESAPFRRWTGEAG